MVRIDLQVALRFNLQIENAVACNLVEHVIEERHTGVELACAATVEIKLDAYLRLFRIASDFGAALAHSSGVAAVVSNNGGKCA